MKFRSRKNPKQVIKFSVSDFKNGLYKTKLGYLKMAESLPHNICDAQLTMHNGQYHLIVPFKTNVTVAENQGGVVALDPGVRTFQTFFSPDYCCEIGKSDR